MRLNVCQIYAPKNTKVQVNVQENLISFYREAEKIKRDIKWLEEYFQNLSQNMNQ